MWPELMPGRGSGAVPVKRAAERASRSGWVGDVFFELGEVFYCGVVEFGVETGGGGGLGRILWGGWLRSRPRGLRRGGRRVCAPKVRSIHHARGAE